MGVRAEALLVRLSGLEPAADLLGRLARRAPAGRATLHRALLARAETRRRWSEALLHAREICRLEPGDAAMRLHVSRMLRRLGFLDESAEQLEALLERDPDHPRAWLMLARIHFKRRRFDEARRCCREACSRGGRTPKAVFELARSEEQAGDPVAARALYQEVADRLAKSAGTARDFQIWSRTLQHLDDVAGRAEVLGEALRRFPVTPRLTRQWLLDFCAVAPLDDELLRLCASYAASHPDDEAFWFARPAQLVRAGRNAEAAVHLRAFRPAQRDPMWCQVMEEVDPTWFADGGRRPVPARRRAPGDLAAVCCYFNPLAYRSRRRNFEIFHRHVRASGVPLLTVELAFGDDPFELEDYEGVLRLRGDAVLFQKERILNVGIARLLEEGYPKIAWLDADIVFEEPDWAEAVSRTLDEYLICQAFDWVYVRDEAAQSGSYVDGTALADQREELEIRRLGHTGFAWAARAELLSEMPLYDAHIGGGGDFLIALACYADGGSAYLRKRYGMALEEMPPRMRGHYESWAKSWAARVRGRVGATPTPLQSLYHGTIANRRYTDRYDVMGAYGYDPDADLRVDENGCWSWASDKPELHAGVADYFRTRREDDGL